MFLLKIVCSYFNSFSLCFDIKPFVYNILASPNKVPPVYKYLKDMELIHEIVINNDFEMKKVDSPEKRFVLDVILLTVSSTLSLLLKKLIYAC